MFRIGSRHYTGMRGISNGRIQRGWFQRRASPEPGVNMIEQEDPVRLIYTTFATVEDAERCGGALVERRLAACVNIIPGMVSIYEWQGRLGREAEAVMIVKTRAAALPAAMDALRRMHPYETPALLVIAPEAVDPPFAAWIRDQTDAA